MKLAYFFIALIINLGGMVLVARFNIGNSGLLLVPALTILGAIAIMRSDEDEVRKESAWWLIWGTLSSFVVGLVILLVFMNGHC